MSLAFNFNLTTAQTRMLVTIANYHFGNADGTDDPRYAVPIWRPPAEGGMDHFISIIRRLQAKGLVSHDPHRSPTYQPTPEGLALAALIVRDAQALVDLTKGVERRRRIFKAKPIIRSTQ